MAAPNEKSQSLTGDAQQPAVITHPEKATLSNASTICAMPLGASPRDSFATPRSESGGNPFDTDIEAAMISQSTTRKSCQLPRKSDCQVWPSRDHWKEKAKAAKKKRSWTWMARLNRRDRLIAKIVLGLILVGVAVGVGFGVSKPLGAPIWGKKDTTD